MLEDNLKNYGYFSEVILLPRNIYVNVDRDISTIKDLDNLYNGIMNILRDGIELEYIQNKMVDIDFGKNRVITLSLFDFFINLIFWRGILLSGDKIKTKHIFFEEEFTSNHIKNYIDKHVIDVHRKDFSNKRMNLINAITLQGFKFISEFALYIANTINIEDDIRLMMENPEVYDIFHLTDQLENVPLDQIKQFSDDKTKILIDYITSSEFHAFKDYFKAQEGINKKQYREYAVNIGTKPDIMGGVFPSSINTSFIRGGLKKLKDLFIESNAGRTAQTLTKTNVGDSGHFARILGLNNSDTFIHPNKNYSCNTKHLQKIFISSDKVLKKFNKRWYSLHEKNGMEYLLDSSKDKHLIGKTLFFRSPMTCASAAEGKGVCYRCYGELAYVNYDINIGKLAVELLSSILTQILLSAKHLLESVIKKIEWSKGFDDYCILDGNIIILDYDALSPKHKIIIDPELISIESEQDNYEYNEYVSSFIIQDAHGNQCEITSNDGADLYISVDLNEIIRKHGIPLDGKISISVSELEEVPLFLIKIHNNEISKTLKKLQNIINKDSETKKYDKDSLLQTFINTLIDGNLNLQAVHAEVILSNQIRDLDNILQTVNWNNPYVQYQILTLNSALTYNPSIIISMSYQRLPKVLYNPLSFSPEKNKPSFLDLFFMLSPQVFMENNEKEFTL